MPSPTRLELALPEGPLACEGAERTRRRALRAQARAQAATGRPALWAWLAIALGVTVTLGGAYGLVQASQAYGKGQQLLPSRSSSKFPAPTWVPQRPKEGTR